MNVIEERAEEIDFGSFQIIRAKEDGKWIMREKIGKDIRYIFQDDMGGWISSPHRKDMQRITFEEIMKKATEYCTFLDSCEYF